MRFSVIQIINRIRLKNAPSNTAVANVIVQDTVTKELHSISRAAFNKELQDQVEDLKYPDGVLKHGAVVISESNATVAVGAFQWRLNKVSFLNPPAYTSPIISATVGYFRSDILAGDSFGNYHIILGEEDEVAAPETNTPDGMVRLALIPIFGASIGSPEIVFSGLEEKENKNQPNGYLGLDVNGKPIGLENVDNTSDLDKPISTANQTVLDLKSEKTYVDSQDGLKLAEAKTYADGLITQLINGAPDDGNTLKELNDKILVVKAIIGGTTADGDALVNTVAELLAVFATFPEGVDLVTLLAGKVNTADVYNALDCIVAGKVADARQLKVLNDLITNLTTTVGGKEDTSNKSNAIETDKASTTKYGNIAAWITWLKNSFVNNLPAKATAMVDADLILMGDSEDGFKTKTRTFVQLKATLKTYWDTFYQTWILAINPIAGTTYTIGVNDYKTKNTFTNANPIAFTVPANASVAVPIGVRFSYTVQGVGTVTISGAGITFVQNNLIFTTGNTFFLEKIATDTWIVFGPSIDSSYAKTNSDNNFSTVQNFLNSIEIGGDVQTGNRHRLRISSPSYSATVNPKVHNFDFYASHPNMGFETNVFFRLQDTNFADGTLTNIFSLKNSGGIKTVTIYANLALTGSISLGSVVLNRSTHDVISFSDVNYTGGSIKTALSALVSRLEYRVTNGYFSGASGTNHVFYGKANAGASEVILFEMKESDAGVISIVTNGSFKSGGYDLSALGAYANDAAAATGGVAVGFGYINSSTGALQRRLT